MAEDGAGRSDFREGSVRRLPYDSGHPGRDGHHRSEACRGNQRLLRMKDKEYKGSGQDRS